MQMALNHCKKHNIDLDIEVYDRTKYPVMYEDMPRFLKKYKLYVDIRFVEGKILNHLALQLNNLWRAVSKYWITNSNIARDYQLNWREKM